MVEKEHNFDRIGDSDMFRHECKYIINTADALTLSHRLEVLLERDSHCGHTGDYTVNSLYFDNYNDKALKEKLYGIDKREKFRIRYYNHDLSFINLEKKSKIKGLCLKQSAAISVEQCEMIIEGKTNWMRESSSNLVRELYSKMRYQQLRPVSIVTYDREAFVYAPGNCRITLDKNLKGCMNVYSFLNDEYAYDHADESTILEVKWDEFLPQVVRYAVQVKCRSVSAFSKYAAARGM